MDQLRLAARQPISRRDWLKASALAGAGLVAGGLAGSQRSRAQEGPLAPAFVEVWYQDYPPFTAAYQATQAAIEATQPDLTFHLIPVPSDQLQGKVQSTLAAATEPEIMMAASSWLLNMDITTVLAPLVPAVMSAEAAAAISYPGALAEGARGDALYYLPMYSGVGGSVWTYNVDHLEAAGIDPATLTTWNAFVDAGKALTQWDGANLLRAGISISPYVGLAWVTGIGQLGGSWFDPATGIFDLTSGPAIKALLKLDDLLKRHKVDDMRFEAPTPAHTTGYYGTYDGFEQGKCSITNWGPEYMSGLASSSPTLRMGILPTPSMGETPAQVELGHGYVHLFSRRLNADPAKAAAAGLFVTELAKQSASVADAYAGSLVSPVVARDATIGDRHWGGIQQQLDQLVWPNAHVEEHHIADWMTSYAWPQLYQVFTASAAVDVVLRNLEDQANQLELTARTALGL